MVTLDVVQTAALSDRPWDRLDELVRAEMATGRKVAEIADDFIKMIDAVYYTPGLSEDGSDAFGDTLDALTGNCGMESSCYRDPPEETSARNGTATAAQPVVPTESPSVPLSQP